MNNEVQLLIIHGLHVCKLAYSLNFICNPKINASRAFLLLHGRARKGEDLSCPTPHFQLRSNKAIFCLLISALRL